MSTQIELSRAAGEKRQEAKAKFEELQGLLQKQVAGELDDESRLSHEEIAQRRKEVEDLVTEAKSIEGVDDLDKILSREDGSVHEKAREILNEAENAGRDREERKRQVFSNVGEFLRTIRTINGKYSHDPVKLDDTKRRALQFLYEQATKVEQNERAMSVKNLGDLDLKALVGDDTGSDGRGDYLVPTEHMAELLRTMGENQQMANRARRVPMTRRTADFPRLKQTDADDTRPMFSFAAVTKIAEGAQKPEREPEFEQLVLTAIKYAAYLEASDELLSDSIVDVPPVLVELLTSAIAYEYDKDTFSGGGSSEPQGFIGSAAEYAVNRATSNEIAPADIFEMEARFFGDNGVYFHHPSTIPELYALAASNVIVWNADLSSDAPGVLLGRPLVKTHKVPALNTKGDLSLVDPSFYLVGDLQRITIANSIHAQFRNDVTAWRATFRGAGTPWPAGTFSHEASGGSKTYEVSPFVTLDVISS